MIRAVFVIVLTGAVGSCRADREHPDTERSGAPLPSHSPEIARIPAGGGPAAAASADSPVETSEKRASGCFSGFRAVGDPRIDAHRLALLCGPSSGMLPLPRGVLEGRVDEGGHEGVHTRRVVRGSCFRFFAAAEGTVEDLEVEVAGDEEHVLALDNRSSNWAVVPPEGLLCPERDGELRLAVRTHGGAGRYVVELWYLP